MKKRFGSTAALIAVIILSCFIFACTPGYRKMNPPADADKPVPIVADNSCYLATAANMLAGAGYGDGADLQARADDIYGDLTAQFGIASGGWTDAALSWWLGSANNTWPTNPYTVVTVYGNKSPKNPWAEPDGAEYIGNELRKCNFIGLSISWPVAGATVGSGGHAITCWGDNIDNDSAISANPLIVAVSDSDTDTGGDEQTYTYDGYTSPNPGGANEGDGWYFNYSANHPYIKHIIVLSPTDDPSDGILTQKVVGSYKIHQAAETPAIDLHYRVSTDSRVLSYRTWLDIETPVSPTITETGSPRSGIQVDWDLKEKPVAYCDWVTINTEFVLPNWNALSYSDVHFTYPDGLIAMKLPYFMWKLESPLVKKAESIPNITGGYVIGSFDVYSPDTLITEPLVKYRFIHEYSYNQNPELHFLSLLGEQGFIIQNLKLGHSYGYLSTKEIWRFEKWLITDIKPVTLDPELPAQIVIDWKGKLPYPEGEDIFKAVREIDNKKQKE